LDFCEPELFQGREALKGGCMSIIGSADEFWRLRVTRVDTTDDFDFEWHDDILYREPTVEAVREVEMWHVEAVSLEDAEHVVRMATFTDRAQAEGFFDRSLGDLAEMTRSQFDATYLSKDHSADDDASTADD